MDEGTLLKAYDGILGPLHLDIELLIDAEHYQPGAETVTEIETHYTVRTTTHRIIGDGYTCSTTGVTVTRHHELENAMSALTGTIDELIILGANLIEREI